MPGRGRNEQSGKVQRIEKVFRRASSNMTRVASTSVLRSSTEMIERVSSRGAASRRQPNWVRSKWRRCHTAVARRVAGCHHATKVPRSIVSGGLTRKSADKCQRDYIKRLARVIETLREFLWAYFRHGLQRSNTDSRLHIMSCRGLGCTWVSSMLYILDWIGIFCQNELGGGDAPSQRRSKAAKNDGNTVECASAHRSSIDSCQNRHRRTKFRR